MFVTGRNRDEGAQVEAELRTRIDRQNVGNTRFVAAELATPERPGIVMDAAIAGAASTCW